MLAENWFNCLLLLSLALAVLYNRYPSAMRSGYILFDLPIMLVALSLTFCFECLVYLLPDFLFRQQRLNGKLVLLTGAGSGIGRATSLELSKQGCTLVLWDLDEAGNAETCRQVRDNGGRAFTYTVDVSDRGALEETADAVVREYGPVDILVCNAGILHINRLYNIQYDEIEQLMSVNFLSIVCLTKLFLNQMIERGSGHIVCISSSYALRAGSHSADYSASKGALSGYCISLMGELSKMGCKDVHVSVVYPAFVNTPLISSLSKYFEYLKPMEVKKVAKRIVSGVRAYRQFIYIPNFLKLFSFMTFLTPITFPNLMIKYHFQGNKFDPIKPDEKFDT